MILKATIFDNEDEYEHLKREIDMMSLPHAMSQECLDVIGYPEGFEGMQEGVQEAAKKVIDWLPRDVKIPGLGINADGSILFEWNNGAKGDDIVIFSIEIEERRQLIWSLFTKKGEKSKGFGNLCKENINLFVTNYLRPHFPLNKQKDTES